MRAPEILAGGINGRAMALATERQEIPRATADVSLSAGNERTPVRPQQVPARGPLTGVRLQRLRDVAQLLANEVGEVGDAILIVREVARACGGKVNESLVSLLAKTAGVVAAECGSARGRVAVLSGEAYDETKHLLGNATAPEVGS